MSTHFPSDEALRIVVTSLDSGETRVIVENGTTAQYVPTGHLVFARDGELLAAPFDLDRLELMGPAVTVVTDVMMTTHPGSASFAVSDNGTLVYQSGGIHQPRRRLLSFDRDGNVEALAEEPRNYGPFRFSPDGQRLAAQITERSADIWIYDLARGVWDKLTDGAGHDNTPIWSPDGLQLAFASDRDGTRGIYVVPADGSSPPQRIMEAEYSIWPSSWSPDGRVIALDGLSPTGRHVWMLPADGSGAAELFQEHAAFPAFSPDGRWVAFSTGLDGTEGSADGFAEGVHIASYPDGSARFIASNGPAMDTRWSPDGRELYYFFNGIFAISFDSEPEVRLGKPRQLAARGSPLWDVAPDGRFAIARWVEPINARTTHVNVVLNWFEELKQRVPVPR